MGAAPSSCCQQFVLQFQQLKLPRLGLITVHIGFPTQVAQRHSHTNLGVESPKTDANWRLRIGAEVRFTSVGLCKVIPVLRQLPVGRPRRHVFPRPENAPVDVARAPWRAVSRCSAEATCCATTSSTNAGKEVILIGYRRLDPHPRICRRDSYLGSINASD